MKYEVVIIGGGPGGLSAAEALAKAGKKVLLLEKNEEIGPKVCAGGITTRDLAIGVPLDLLDYKFNKAILNTRFFKTIFKQDKPFIGTINRQVLGEWLRKKAEKVGAEIRTNSKVTKINKDSVIINKEETVKYKYLIGADGSYSLTRSYLGIPVQSLIVCMQYLVKKQFEDLEIFFDKRKFGLSYAWIFPHKGFDSIGAGMYLNGLKTGKIKDNLHQWLKDMKVNLKGAEWQTHAINYDYRGAFFKNIFLVGDAAGFTSGFSGEGMYFAMVSGREIARKIIDSKYTCPKIKEILALKIKQEKYLEFLQRRPSLITPCFELGNLLFKFDKYQKKAINLFC